MAPAQIRFTLAEPDRRVTVAIIDGRGGSEGAHRRTIASDLALDAGSHTFMWNGRDEWGNPVAPGPYALEVTLGEAGREIQPPGRIEVLP